MENEETVEKKNKEWQAIRDECTSGGAMSIDCNLVAVSQGVGEIEIVAQRLSCGCILVPVENDDDLTIV